MLREAGRPLAFREMALGAFGRRGFGFRIGGP
jgi:hypothetical protein